MQTIPPTPINWFCFDVIFSLNKILIWTEKKCISWLCIINFSNGECKEWIAPFSWYKWQSFPQGTNKRCTTPHQRNRNICKYLRVFWLKKPYHLVFLSNEFLFLSFRYAFSVFSLHWRIRAQLVSSWKHVSATFCLLCICEIF